MHTPRQLNGYAILFLILAAAAAVRLANLDARTLQHVESYTPGLVFPPELCDPCTRLTQGENWRWAIQDVHGPTWYLWMLPYVKAAGTSLTAIRLPAALMGILSVWLTYLAGRRTLGEPAALAGAALLALNAHHVYWSQTARMYSWACLLSLLSTYALLRLTDSHRPRLWLAGYLMAILAGLSTIHYFWPVFLIQLTWTALAAQRRNVLAWQLLAGLLATPLFTLIVYQARPSTLGADAVHHLKGYFAFAFTLIPNIDTGSGVPWQTPWQYALPVLALVALASARTAFVATSDSKIASTEPQLLACGQPIWLALLALAAAAATILYAIPRATAQFPHKTVLLYATLLAPAAFFGARLLLAPIVSRLDSLPIPAWTSNGRTLAALLAFAPPLLIAAVSLKVPLFAPRGLTLFAPFVLLFLGAGLVSLYQRNRLAGAIIALAVLSAHAQSLSFMATDQGPTDYAGLASELQEKLEPGDVAIVRRHWSTTPIFYHLPAERLRYVEAGQALDAAGRVWVIEFIGVPVAAPESSQWRLQETIHSTGAEARLYVRTASRDMP